MAIARERVARQCVCCGGTDLEKSPAIVMPFVADRAFGWKPAWIDESWGLRTIAQGMAYTLCNSVLCLDCGHLFCDIRFSDAEMNALYDDYRGAAYTLQRDTYEPGYAARNALLSHEADYVPSVESFIEPFLGGPLTLLDWGGGDGKNTPFKKRGVRLDVYDISNVPVIDGLQMVARHDALSRKYRLIVCSMVLEHIPYPDAMLIEMQGAMDAQSLLYIEVPLEPAMRGEGPAASTAKRHWHEHVNFYSPTSLRRLVERCGLEVLALEVLTIEFEGADFTIFQLACRLRRD